jgi:addiction module HigA family antidote
MHNPPHPGRSLKEAIDHVPMTVTDFAAHVKVSRNSLSRILNQKAGITPEMSIRIGMAFGHTPDLWYKMQTAHDFWVASQNTKAKIKQVIEAA